MDFRNCCRSSKARRSNKTIMILIVIFIPVLLLSLSGNIKESGIPEPLIAALLGTVLLTLAALLKRIGGAGR